MADQTELRMNLVAIKRVDPYAKDIINSSAHVAFYVFNNEDSEWEKTDIEGALFIYSRFAEPFHSIFINNRLNTNSLVEPIRGQIELQSKPPFLLYRNERSRIRGFWFYNNTECDRIGEIIQRLVTDCAEAEKLNPVVNGGGGAGGGSIPPGMLPVMNGNGPAEVEANNVDIFSMLTKAQEDYQNNAATTTGGGAKDPAVINHTGMTVLGGHNMPIVPVPATQQQHHQQQQQQQPISNQNAPRSVVNFFAAAKQPAASEVPLFKTHAPVHTLEQIEKLHRASTPQKDLTIAGSVNTTGKLTPDLNELKRMGAIPIMGSGNGPHTPSGGLPELGTSPLATFLSTANLSTAMRLNNNQAAVPKAKLIDISELESRQNHHSQQQQQTPLHELLKKSESIAVTGTPTTPSIVRPALMPPTMFKPTVAASSSVGVAGTPGTGTVGPQSALSDLFTQVTSRSAGGGGTVAVSGAKVSSGATGKQAGSSSGAKGGKSRDGTGNTPPKQAGGTPKSVADILSKAAANSKQNNNVHNATSTASGNANGSNNNNNLSSSSNAAGGTVEPLTQNQLIQAVSYLIKHDPDFVRKLHEAYVRSFAEMMISN